MKRLAIVLIPVAAQVAAPAAAQDFDVFRACVEEVEVAAITATFHHCTGVVAQPCGASANAKEAAECIDGKRAAVEAELDVVIARLAARPDETEEGVRDALNANRSSGEASCAVMANQDAAKGVAVGQRAVNGAFCQLIVSGDVLGMAYRLEKTE